MTSILHITPRLCGDRCPAAPLGIADGSPLQHTVVSLAEADGEVLAAARAARLVVACAARDEVDRLAAAADVLHLHWWNDPLLMALLRSPLPPARVLITFHRPGNIFPHIIFPALASFFDFALLTSSVTVSLIGRPAADYALQRGSSDSSDLQQLSAHEAYERILQTRKSRRFWGLPARTPVAGLQFTLNDIENGRKALVSGHQIFMESLGHLASPFDASVSGDADQALAADEEILGAEGVARAEGLKLYSDCFAHDPYLRLWQGLSLAGAGSWELSAPHFETSAALAAVESLRWRAHWYLTLAALHAKRWQQAADSLNAVLPGAAGACEAPHRLSKDINRPALIVRSCTTRRLDYAIEYPCLCALGAGLEEVFARFLQSGLCAYWEAFDATWRRDGDGFELTPSARELLAPHLSTADLHRTYWFRDNAAFLFCRHLTPETLRGRPLIFARRAVPAAADGSTRRAAQALSQEAGESARELIDLPLRKRDGALFCLGAVEEVLLQSLLFGTLPASTCCTFNFELLSAGDSGEFKRLCDTIGIALPGGVSSSSSTPPPASAEGQARALLLEPLMSGAETPPAELPEAFHAASVLWIKRIHRTLERLQLEPGSFCTGSLPAFAGFVEQLPLLQAAFCALLRNTEFAGFAEDRLRTLSVHGTRWVKLAAAAILAKTDDPRALQQYSFFLQQLEPEDRQYFNEFFGEMVDVLFGEE